MSCCGFLGTDSLLWASRGEDRQHWGPGVEVKGPNPAFPAPNSSLNSNTLRLRGHRVVYRPENKLRFLILQKLSVCYPMASCVSRVISLSQNTSKMKYYLPLFTELWKASVRALEWKANTKMHVDLSLELGLVPTCWPGTGNCIVLLFGFVKELIFRKSTYCWYRGFIIYC